MPNKPQFNSYRPSLPRPNNTAAARGASNSSWRREASAEPVVTIATSAAQSSPNPQESGAPRSSQPGRRGRLSVAQTEAHQPRLETLAPERGSLIYMHLPRAPRAEVPEAQEAPMAQAPNLPIVEDRNSATNPFASSSSQFLANAGSRPSAALDAPATLDERTERVIATLHASYLQYSNAHPEIPHREVMTMAWLTAAIGEAVGVMQRQIRGRDQVGAYFALFRESRDLVLEQSTSEKEWARGLIAIGESFGKHINLLGPDWDVPSLSAPARFEYQRLRFEINQAIYDAHSLLDPGCLRYADVKARLLPVQLR